MGVIWQCFGSDLYGGAPIRVVAADLNCTGGPDVVGRRWLGGREAVRRGMGISGLLPLLKGGCTRKAEIGSCYKGQTVRDRLAVICLGAWQCFVWKPGGQ